LVTPVNKPALLKFDSENNRQLARSTKAERIDTSILESKLGYQLRMTDRAMSRDFVQDVGMTQVQYSVLSLIATNNNPSQVDVGESLGMDRASTMAIINKLEAAGLVRKRLSTIDKRMHALQLTEDGEKLFPEINRKVIEHENRFQEKLTKTEQAVFLKCLWKIRNQ
jgi:MarR family transcriptional regulator, organic hydroperoxide resistance regulator